MPTNASHAACGTSSSVPIPFATPNRRPQWLPNSTTPAVPIGTSSYPLLDADSRTPANSLVVVVEDDPLVRLAISAFLAELGCEVLAVGSADAASSVFRSLSRQPRLVICDYCLPDGANGLQVIGAARACFGDDVPAYLMTGTVSADVLTRSVEAGIPVIYKPVSPTTLETIVERSCD